MIHHYFTIWWIIWGYTPFSDIPTAAVEAAVICRDYVGDRLHHLTISRVQISKTTYSQAKQCFRQLSSTRVKKQLGLFARSKTYIRVCSRMNWHLASLSLKWRSNMHEIWGCWQSLQTNPSHRPAICTGRSRNIRHDYAAYKIWSTCENTGETVKTPKLLGSRLLDLINSSQLFPAKKTAVCIQDRL